MGAGGYFQDQYGGDDLFATYIDLDKIPLLETSEDDGRHYNLPHQHRRCNSESNNVYSSAPPDGSDRSGRDVILEAKKAMPPDKLAELWTIDPKRAKRILANRQSAARSKERKARYIAELEHKLRSLQTEATTLSAQLSLFQRDTTGLTTENNELKMQLQAMEQQAQLQDALNEALMQEIERMKMATGELSTSNSNLPNSITFANPNNLVQTSYTFSPYNNNPTMPTTPRHQTSAAPLSNHHQLCLAQHESVAASYAAECTAANDDGLTLISSVGAVTQSNVVKSDVVHSSFSGTESSTTS